MRKVIMILCFVTVGLSACDEKEGDVQSSTGDYLIFGRFYGECLGDGCLEIFKLESDRLLEDTEANYITQTNRYESDSWRVLDQSQFEQAKGLIDNFPNQLLNEPDTVFGCPDCYDQGGLYIEYNFGKQHKAWIIDQTQADVPNYLHEFMDQVNETINAFNR